jgi:tetratricopeptide (TPR) repeat protein
MRALVSGDRLSYQVYRENAGMRLESVKKSGVPGTTIRLSYMHLQSSLLNIFHKEYFEAARNYYSASRLQRLAEKEEYNNPGNDRLRGILALISGSVPEEYEWLLRIFRFNSSAEDGFRILERETEKDKGISQLESCLVLLYAAIMLDYQSIYPSDYFTSFGIEFPNNPLLTYGLALFDLKTGKSERLIKQLESYHPAKDSQYFYFLDLIEGEARLNLLDSRAGEKLEDFLSRYSGEHYVKLAWNKLSWHYFLAGDTQKYLYAKKQVSDQGIAVVDSDRQALAEASDSNHINPVLLKARLLFDGGQYERALYLIDKQDVSLVSLHDSVEYNYRLARIYDLMGDEDKAIIQYTKVMDEGGSTDWYFPANAALHAGILYESKGNAGQALDLYKRCLKMNHSSYKKSIAFRARQGIRRLED